MLDQQRVVVQHFFEVRDQPVGIDAVACESAAEMIVNAALTDVLGSQYDSVSEADIRGSLIGSPKHFEQTDLGKLGRTTDASGNGIDLVENGKGYLIYGCHRYCLGGRCP